MCHERQKKDKKKSRTCPMPISRQGGGSFRGNKIETASFYKINQSINQKWNSKIGQSSLFN